MWVLIRPLGIQSLFISLTGVREAAAADLRVFLVEMSLHSYCCCVVIASFHVRVDFHPLHVGIATPPPMEVKG